MRMNLHTQTPQIWNTGIAGTRKCVYMTLHDRYHISQQWMRQQYGTISPQEYGKEINRQDYLKKIKNKRIFKFFKISKTSWHKCFEFKKYFIPCIHFRIRLYVQVINIRKIRISKFLKLRTFMFPYKIKNNNKRQY